MAKQVSTASIRSLAKNAQETVNIKIGELIISVKQYLPILEKMNLINQVVDIAFENREDSKIFNSVLYDMALSYFITTNYTNVNIAKDKFSEMYDILKSTNLLSGILEAIPDSEFEFITSHAESRIEEMKTAIANDNSIGGAIKQFLSQYGETMEEMKGVLDKFDPETMDKVQTMIEATTNGNQATITK